MKRHRHTPEQIVRKLRVGKRLLNEGRDLAEVLRQLRDLQTATNESRQLNRQIVGGPKRRPCR
jgi:hypothetical protein